MEHIAVFDTFPYGMTDFSGLGRVDGILFCHFCHCTEGRKELAIQSAYNEFRLKNRIEMRRKYILTIFIYKTTIVF